MTQTTTVYGVGQGLCNMVLPDHLPEELGPRTPGQNLVVFGYGCCAGLGVGRTATPLGTSSGSFENVSDS
jgi:hypothetical protein